MISFSYKNVSIAYNVSGLVYENAQLSLGVSITIAIRYVKHVSITDHNMIVASMKVGYFDRKTEITEFKIDYNVLDCYLQNVDRNIVDALDDVNLAFVAFITKLKISIKENKKYTISSPIRVVKPKPWIMDYLCNKIKF